METLECILTLSRMARRLGVTQRWLKAEAEAGTIPCLKAGSRLLFDADVVAETLRARIRGGRRDA